jgi:hypothetical protein
MAKPDAQDLKIHESDYGHHVPTQHERRSRMLWIVSLWVQTLAHRQVREADPGCFYPETNLMQSGWRDPTSSGCTSSISGPSRVATTAALVNGLANP